MNNSSKNVTTLLGANLVIGTEIGVKRSLSGLFAVSGLRHR
jgi:hypothetical protein